MKTFSLKSPNAIECCQEHPSFSRARKLSYRRASPFGIAFSLLVGGCAAPQVQPAAPGPSAVLPRALPVPTEHRLDAGAEARQKLRREAWIESMHKTADGVDWRAIERANGLAEQARRGIIGHQRRAAGSAAAWTEIGSSNLAGRMHAAVVGPDGDAIYAGSALGGVWRGTVAGGDWTPLGDNLYGGAHELLVLPGEYPGEPDVILAATDGGAVNITRDDGLTWEAPAGLDGLTWVHGLAVLDDAPRTILIYARGPAAGFMPAIYSSIDYGRTFSPRWQAPQDWSGFMWVPRVGPRAAATVYVAHLGQLRRSTDGGFTCPVVGSIASGTSRAVLTGSEAGAPTLYAAVLVSGQWKLYRSDDGGAGWQFVYDINDFWESLCASVTNPDLVIFGGVEAWRSTSGGTSFSKINNWSDYYDNPVIRLHADIPGIHCWPDPQAPGEELWFISTDGGVYRSDTQGASVANISLEGLGVSQYYSTLTSTTNALRILAGAQDQGYQRGIQHPPSGPGPSTPFTQLISGDYGHLTSTDGSHALVYSTYPGFILIQEGESFPDLHFADFPSGAANAWLPPVVAHPENPHSFFFCANLLYRYVRSGDNWFPVQHSSYDFATGAGSYISALAFAPTDAQRVYAVTDGGKLLFSTDQGLTWTQGSGSAPGQQYFYGNAIAVHPADPLEVAVGGSGYSASGVVRSVDGGNTWQPEVAGLPATLVYALAYAADSGDLFAGTETGAYRWDRRSGAWENIMSNEAPITIYWSVESVGETGVIRYGTYGRGIWDHDPAPAAAPCAALADCADAAPLDGLRDDSCTWWDCASGACAATEVHFADLGGAFGACPPDGTADANDRFHALNCFSDTDTLGLSGYGCEDQPPAAYNVDAGGAFGQCCPDGICDAHDAFHALNSFTGDNPCRCAADGGLSFSCPCPAPTDPPDSPVLCPAGPAPSGGSKAGK